MKKLLMLALISFSLHAQENTHILEEAIISSDFQKVTILAPNYTLSKSEKKRLLKLSDEIITKRHNSLNQNPLFSCISGTDAFATLLIGLATKCIHYGAQDATECIIHASKAITNCDQGIASCQKLFSLCSNSECNEWNNELTYFEKRLEDWAEERDNCRIAQKILYGLAGIGFAITIFHACDVVTNAQQAYKKLDTELTNALLIYQFLYQIETIENTSNISA